MPDDGALVRGDARPLSGEKAQFAQDDLDNFLRRDVRDAQADAEGGEEQGEGDQHSREGVFPHRYNPLTRSPSPSTMYWDTLEKRG